MIEMHKILFLHKAVFITFVASGNQATVHLRARY